MSGSFAKMVGQLLARARAKAGLSQAQLGKAAGTNQSAVQRIESATFTRRRVTRKDLEPYAAALKVPVSDLWPPSGGLPPATVADLDAARARVAPEDAEGWDDFISEFAQDISQRELEILKDLHYVKVVDRKLGAGDWLLMWRTVRRTLDRK